MTKTPLLLLPGLLCDSTLWKAQMDNLHDVALPSVADLTLDESIEEMARRALANAPKMFALAGLSMGGYVAFEIMRQAPERVSRLAVLDTTASPDTPERTAKRQSAIDSLKHGRFAGVTDRLLPQLIKQPNADDTVANAVKEMAARVGKDAYIRQQTAILHRQDSRPVLARVRVPTLVCVGDSDLLTPISDALAIHHGIKGSALHVFSNCGHLPALEKPRETSALLRMWLGG